MTTLLRHVALVPDDNVAGQLEASDVTRVAAALQKQVTRDFAPIWDVHATVSAFTRLKDVPVDYWPIIVGQENQGGGGVHLDRHKQPFALVDLTPDWTVTASHECLEMLADPFGNRLIAGDSPNPKRPGRVRFLVEVCDPCEATTLGYTVNGVRVSDFYTPNYFDPAQKAGPANAVRYDFMGHITAPRQVLRDGYLSWVESNGDWWQALFFSGSKPTFKKLPPGSAAKQGESLRVWIDSMSLAERKKALEKRAKYAPQVLVRLPGEHSDDNDYAERDCEERARMLQEDIDAARRAAPAPGSATGRGRKS